MTQLAGRERGILFQGWGVREIREGRKTQTRRVIRPKPPALKGQRSPWGNMAELLARCPYGRPGDLLWVRETWAPNEVLPLSDRPDGPAIYKADGRYDATWRPPIHMPRWACRLTLRLTEMRVQRVQDISAQDAVAEGLPPLSLSDGGVGEFRRAWDAINAKRGYGWEANPWVWALSFERVKP